MVQNQLRNARLPRKQGSYRICIDDSGEYIESIFVWRSAIDAENGNALFRLEFLATHFDRRHEGLAAHAYEEFMNCTFDVIDQNPAIRMAEYEADVHRDNQAMRKFLSKRQWRTTGEYIDDDYLVFVKRIQIAE